MREEKNEIPLGKYKHFKGKMYEVLSVARDCENPKKKLVVYKALYEGDFPRGQIWVRQLEDFSGEKEFENGTKVKRFEFLGENKIILKVKRIHPDAVIPHYAHPGDAGLDLYSCEDVEIAPGSRKLVGTGLSIELPEGYVSLIWDKSGIAYKDGQTTMAGVIEYTYRGEYKILLYNTTNEIYKISKGQKIAQLLIQPIVNAQIEEVDKLSETIRGDGGFGSTGK